ncbi:hypothetical protein DSO57_1003118 [Entomophthora muscae]|uniref:Uncharacterized protein n=2 Tax=Entomophthora muscae TaxID=34485 RepID=A0ACC2UTE0_9FUNG|nr:hypothetical protein DSO57_1003118 [Entomophthora muscae]
MKRSNDDVSQNGAALGVSTEEGIKKLKDSCENGYSQTTKNGKNSTKIITETWTSEIKMLQDNCVPGNVGKALKRPPTDGISSVTFPENNDKLLMATSWDKHAYIYDVENNELITSFNLYSPLLDGCFENAAIGYIGGADGRLHKLDLVAKVKTLCGSHEKGISCVKFLDSRKVPITGSWDKTMKIWDPIDNSQKPQCVKLTSKAISMDTSGNYIGVAQSDRIVEFFDVRRLDTPFHRMKSSLQLATRCIRFSPRSTNYALSSIEGRIAIESFDLNPEKRASAYKIRCHLRKADDGFDSYPVNALCFNHHNGTLLSGGGDGEVCIWDIKEAKRIHRYGGYPTSISDIAVTTNGKYLAVASSYTWEQGNKEHPLDNLYIHSLEEDLQALGLASENNEA